MKVYVKNRINRDEIHQLWSRFNDVISSSLFRQANISLERNLSASTNYVSIAEMFRSQVLPGKMMDDLSTDTSFFDEILIEKVINLYLERYLIILFKHINNPVRSQIESEVMQYLNTDGEIIVRSLDLERSETDQAEPEEDPVCLDGNEKKLILKEVHTNYFPVLLEQLVLSLRAGKQVPDFEGFQKASPFFGEECRSLAAFDGIRNLKEKKQLVLNLIRAYTDTIVRAGQLNDQSLSQFFQQMSSALGVQRSLQQLDVLRNSPSYPSSLDCIEDLSESTGSMLRGIDVFVHAPESMRNVLLVRTVLETIEHGMAVFKEGQKTPSFSSKKPQDSSFSDQKAPKKQSRAAENLNFFGLFPSSLSSKLDPKPYLEQKRAILESNKKSNCKLFSDIALGRSIDRDDFTKKQRVYMGVKDSSGNTALHLAVLGGSYENFDFLMNIGFDCAEKNSETGDTLLHYAILGENPLIIRDLVSIYRLPVQENNKKGVDSIMLSMMLNSPSEITNILIKAPDFNYSKTYN